MPESTQGFFDPATTTLGPEPPGFDILREMLVRQIIDQKQNPYGMSQEGMGNLQGPLFSSGVKNAPGLGYMGMGTTPPPGGGMPPPGGGGGGMPMAPRGMPMPSQRRGMPGAAQRMGQRQPPQSGWFWELLRQLGPQAQRGRQPQQVSRDGMSYDGEVSTVLPAGGWQPRNAHAALGTEGAGYASFMNANGPRPGDAAGAQGWDARLGASAGQGKQIMDMPGWLAQNFGSAGHGAPAMMVGPGGQIQFPQNTNQGYIRNSMRPGGAPQAPGGGGFGQPLQPGQPGYGPIVETFAPPGGWPANPQPQQPMGPYRPPPRTMGPRPIQPFGVQQPLPSNIGPGPSRAGTQVR